MASPSSVQIESEQHMELLTAADQEIAKSMPSFENGNDVVARRRYIEWYVGKVAQRALEKLGRPCWMVAHATVYDIFVKKGFNFVSKRCSSLAADKAIWIRFLDKKYTGRERPKFPWGLLDRQNGGERDEVFKDWRLMRGLHVHEQDQLAEPRLIEGGTAQQALEREKQVMGSNAGKEWLEKNGYANALKVLPQPDERAPEDTQDQALIRREASRQEPPQAQQAIEEQGEAPNTLEPNNPPNRRRGRGRRTRPQRRPQQQPHQSIYPTHLPGTNIPAYAYAGYPPHAIAWGPVPPPPPPTWPTNHDPIPPPQHQHPPNAWTTGSQHPYDFYAWAPYPPNWPPSRRGR